MRKQIALITAALTIVTVTTPLDAARPRGLGTVIAEIDQRFICPEFLADAAARREELLAFSHALASVGPKRITYRQASYIRAKLLERHNCSAPSAMAAAGAPSVAPPSAPAAIASAVR